MSIILAPVGTAMSPEVESKVVTLAGERAKIENIEPNLRRGNKELEGAIRKRRDMKMRSRTTNGSLEDGAHRGGIEMKTTPAKSYNESEGRRIQSRFGDGQAQPTTNILLNPNPRSKGESRQSHDREKSQQRTAKVANSHANQPGGEPRSSMARGQW